MDFKRRREYKITKLKKKDFVIISSNKNQRIKVMKSIKRFSNNQKR